MKLIGYYIVQRALSLGGPVEFYWDTYDRAWYSHADHRQMYTSDQLDRMSDPTPCLDALGEISQVPVYVAEGTPFRRVLP